MIDKNIVKKAAIIGYIALLFITLGAVLCSGIFVASTIFNSSDVLATSLTRYEEGLLMTAIFIKLNHLIHITVFAILLVELYRFKSFDRDNILLTAVIVAVFSGLLFTQYYTPDILAMQAQGAQATATAAFEAVHKGSEFAFKLFALALAVIGVKNIIRIAK
ncbi:MAG: DUF4149 domain-containing protein [Campylobacterota bacterium]